MCKAARQVWQFNPEAFVEVFPAVLSGFWLDVRMFLGAEVLIETARRETGSDEKAAALLQLSVAEMRDRLGETGKKKSERGGS